MVMINTALIFLAVWLTPIFSAEAQSVAGQNTNNGNQPAENKKTRRSLKHHSGKPPQQAIESCFSKEENSSCSFQGPNFTVHAILEKGFCEFTPDKQYFACNPTRKAKQLKPLK